jgi:hypothetical protein
VARRDVELGSGPCAMGNGMMEEWWSDNRSDQR